jgi:hypothetical protein
MRLISVLLALVVVTPGALASHSGRIIPAHGVRLVVPRGWQRIEATSAGFVTDPRTLLVVGTAGVQPRMSQCQIAAYSIPAAGWGLVFRGERVGSRPALRWSLIPYATRTQVFKNPALNRVGGTPTD